MFFLLHREAQQARTETVNARHSHEGRKLAADNVGHIATDPGLTGENERCNLDELP